MTPFVYYFFVQSFLVWLHMAWVMSGEICKILNIRRFHVKPKIEFKKTSLNYVQEIEDKKEYINVDSQINTSNIKQGNLYVYLI